MRYSTIRHALSIAKASTFVAAMAATNLFAGTSYLQSGGSGKSDGTSNANYWSGGVAPNNSDYTVNSAASTTDFVVMDDRTLRTCNRQKPASLGGASLQIGAEDFSSAGYLGCTTQGANFGFPAAKFYKGGVKYADSNLMWPYGSAEVFATASDPFVFTFYRYSNSASKFRVTLTGNASSAVKIAAGGSSGVANVYFEADQSSTYEGAWTIGPNVVVNLERNSSYGNCYSTRQDFGKALSVFNPAALKLQAGSQITVRRYKNNPYEFFAADNRGMTLDAKSGTVTIRNNNYTQECKSLKFGWPITGEGTLVLSGGGVMELCASCDVPLRITDNATLTLSQGAAITGNGALEIANDTVISLKSATDRVTISNPRIENAKFKFPLSSTPQCAQVRLEGDLSGLTGVIGFGFSFADNVPPTVSTETDLPVFVIDSSVTREFSSADFNPYAVAGAQCPTVSGIKVERDAVSGDQIVSVTLVPYVRSLGGQAGNNVNFANSADWTDKVLPAVGTTKNYLIYDVNVWWSPEGDRDVTAPGQRVTLYNPGGGRYGVLMRTKSFSFGHLLALDKASVTWWGYSGQSGLEQTLGGNLEVRTTANEYVTLNAGSQNAIVSATVAGTGNIFVCTTNTAPGTCSLSLTGTNTGYTGYLCASNTAAAANNKLSLKISDESNLGGNPLVFSAGALTVGNACSLTPTAVVVIDDTNRGVTFNAGAAVDAAASCSLAVKSPIVFSAGTVSKSGAGTFAWGAGGSTIASGATLQVAAGCVKPQGRDALDGLAVSFADGAGFAFDFPLAAGDSRSTYGVDMREASVSAQGSTLAVRPDFDESSAGQRFASCSVPLATFSSVAEARAFADMLQIDTRKFECSLSVVEQTLGAETVATVSARVSRHGFIIVVQ